MKALLRERAEREERVHKEELARQLGQEKRKSSTSSQVDEHHPCRHIPVNVQIADGDDIRRT